MRAPTKSLLLAASIPLLLAACTEDRPYPATAVAPVDASLQSEGRGAFQRYVAVGTSVSMGWRSDGVVASSQATSWPVLLAAMAHRSMTVPAIAGYGCGAPIAAPIAGGVRTSGEGIGQSFDSRSCALNEDGVVLPANNVGIPAATTRNALHTTPENITGEYRRLYSRVLAPGQSQVTAMMAQEPKVVTIELGANEVLGARSGVYLPGITVVPVAAWEADYMKVLDSAQAVAKHVALVGLIDHAASFPSFRTGHEIWQARGAFAQLWVEVSADCENSQNLLFVAVRVPAAAAQGAANARAGAPRASFSCANYPSSTGIQDYVLGPADVAALDAQLAQMDAIILREAQRRGFAHFRLAALYEDVNVKAPFDPIALLMQQQPYGRYVSLDGLHPTADGAEVLANAAARAFDARYGFGITASGTLFAATGN